MTNRFFITGTDTNVGKTLSSCILLRTISGLNFSSVGYKPVSSGCMITNKGLRNKDALYLLNSGNISIPYCMINPITLFNPTSPHIASKKEGINIDILELSFGLSKLEKIADFVIIEGAGGWLTLLGDNITFADWVSYENLPIILVIAIKLGCINHALLTKCNIENRGLRLVGWIANHLSICNKYSNEYLISLSRLMNAPLLGEIPFIPRLEESDITDCYLDISILKSIF